MKTEVSRILMFRLQITKVVLSDYRKELMSVIRAHISNNERHLLNL